AKAAFERRSADVGAAPGVAQEVLGWHHPPGMQHQLMQHRQRLRLEGDPLPTPPELLEGWVEQEGPKHQVVLPRHGGRVPVPTETKPLLTVSRENLHRSSLAANRQGP